MSQLLILGNGFDLACGLKSSFQDFLKWRQVRIDADGPSDPELNAFDIILKPHNEKLSRWADVESAMQALFAGEADHKPVLDIIYNRPLAYSIGLNGEDSSSYFDSHDPLCQFAKNKMGLERSPLRDDLVAFLREELRRHEASFSEYLRQEVSNRGENTLLQLRVHSRNS